MNDQKLIDGQILALEFSISNQEINSENLKEQKSMVLLFKGIHRTLYNSQSMDSQLNFGNNIIASNRTLEEQSMTFQLYDPDANLSEIGYISFSNQQEVIDDLIKFRCWGRLSVYPFCGVLYTEGGNLWLHLGEVFMHIPEAILSRICV